MARMIVVDRDGKEHEIEAKPGLKVMEILRELDYGVAAICGGLCSCATCHVYIGPSHPELFVPTSGDENDLLDGSAHRLPGSRLSCQVVLADNLDGLSVTIAPED